MKPCDEEKNYDAPSSPSSRQQETLTNYLIHADAKEKLFEMTENYPINNNNNLNNNKNKKPREEFESTATTATTLANSCSNSTFWCSSSSSSEGGEDEEGDNNNNDDDEHSSKKRKFVYHGLPTDPTPQESAEQVDTVPPVSSPFSPHFFHSPRTFTTSFPPQTFHALRPKLPLKTVSLQWKDVIWKPNQTMQRLLLINKETKKAYDGDFGFKAFIPMILDDKLEEPNHIYYPPPKTVKKKVLPIYIRRNRSILNPLTKVRTYRIPYFEYDERNHELPPGIQWCLCDGDYRYEYGFNTSSLSSSSIHLSLVQVIVSPFHEPPPLQIPHHCVQKTFLKCTFNDTGHYLYFDHEDIRNSCLIGYSFHPNCFYGDVYHGKEYIEQVYSDPKSATGERRLYSSASPLTSSLASSATSVVIKIVSFDSPLNTYLYPITELSQVEDKFQKVTKTESVVHEIQAMTFLQEQLNTSTPQQHQQQPGEGLGGGNGLNHDNKKLKKFYQLIHYQADNRNLYCITKAYHGGSLLKYIQNKTRFSKLTELETKYIFKQVLQSIQILHSFGMSHLDISPENIVIDATTQPEMITPEIQSVLIDFGQVIAQQYSTMTGKYNKLPLRKEGNVGKKPFHCPELCLFHGEYFQSNYTAYCPQKVDIWQLGILLYMLLTGCTPFSLKCVNELDQNQQFVNWIHFLHERTIKQKEIIWRTDDEPNPQYSTTLCNTDLSGDVLSLLSDLLTLRPDQRPDINRVLQHPWLR